MQDRIAVYNDTDVTHCLMVPSTEKVYNFPPRQGNQPSMMRVPFAELEEIVNSQGGRELLTERLRLETKTEKRANVLEDLGIMEEEIALTREELIEGLEMQDIRALEDFLAGLKPGELEQIPAIVIAEDIQNYSVLRLVERYCDVVLIRRADEEDDSSSITAQLEELQR